MFLKDGEFAKILNELKEVMRIDTVNRIASLIDSLYQANKDLKESRDKWRTKCNSMNGKSK